jgi:NADH:ubiquinone oxidoreductase subunit C
MQHCIIQQYYKNSVQHLTCVSYVQYETCDNENLEMFIQLLSLKKNKKFHNKTMGVNYEPSKTSGWV